MNSKYRPGETIFITEYIFPGEIVDILPDGRYTVEMANSGEIDIFDEDELEPYDADRWHND